MSANNNYLEEILAELYGVSVGKTTEYVLENAHKDSVVAQSIGEAIAKINSHILETALEIIGNNEPQPFGEHWDTYYVNGKNNLRDELRGRFTKQLGLKEESVGRDE